MGPCKGSIIICLIIEGWNEWFDKNISVSFRLFRILSLDEKVQIQLKDKKTLSSFREINGLVIEFNIDKEKLLNTLIGAIKEQLKPPLMILNLTRIEPGILVKGISYRRDNSIIFFKSPYRKKGL